MSLLFWMSLFGALPRGFLGLAGAFGLISVIKQATRGKKPPPGPAPSSVT